MNSGSCNRPKPGVHAAATEISSDGSRKWMWWFLAALVVAQFYFVHELLAALFLFTLVFAALVAMVTAGYAIQRAWVASMVGVEKTVGPLATVSRRGMAFAEDLGRKAFRIRSQHVQ